MAKLIYLLGSNSGLLDNSGAASQEFPEIAIKFIIYTLFIYY